MEKAMTFPTAGVELKYLLVVSDYARALAFYRDVLGATIVREISDVLCLLSFGGGEIMLTVGGGPTQDKPTVTFASPTQADRVTSELVIRVPDCLSAYEVLRSRGAEFLTAPVDWGYEVRAFFRDPDGHLLEVSQSEQQK
ncbi:MAG TPA: VOC family protein [Ktedonobacteraceae bacterium]|nr:VOC family protein [Ktedonobacteraceae bacterium]